MISQKTMRGISLVGIALYFGVQSASYEIGSFDHAGPGLFPLMVSIVVGIIGLITAVQARFEQTEAFHFPLRNMLIILASLAGFVLIAKHIHMLPAIVYLVFVATTAGQEYSVVRNLQISAVLIAIAFALQFFLGLQLELL